MPDPGCSFRKLMVTLAIAIITSRSSGFSIDRVTLDDTDIRLFTDTDQAPQESFKAQSVTNLNDITRDKDDGKAKNKYKFTSEIGLKDSTEESTQDTIQNTERSLDSPGLPPNNQDVANKTSEDLKVTGLKNGSKFNHSKETSNTITTSSGSTVGLSSQSLDNNTDVLDITTKNSGNYTVQPSTSTWSNQENENLTTMTVTISQTKYDITPSTNVFKINDQMAIDSESLEKQTVQNENITENTTEIMNTKKGSEINNILTSAIPMGDDKDENISKLTESTETSENRADSYSMTNSTTPFGHVKNELSNITTETLDTVLPKPNIISIDKETTALLNINKNSYLITESVVTTPSEADLDYITAITTPLDKNKDEKLQPKTVLSYILPASIIDSNSVRSSIVSLSNKEIEESKSTDVKPSISESNSVQALTPSFDYKKNQQPYISTDATDIQRSRADLTTIESKLESSFTSQKEKSASERVEVSMISTNDPIEISTKPSWKKYTTIVRKHLTSSEEIPASANNDTDLAKAESKHTTLPVLMTSTIKDSVSNANLLSTVIEPKLESTVKGPKLKSVTAEFKPTTFEPTQSFSPETLGTVSSKRAGFLDLSKITTAPSEETSTVQETNFNTLYEMETADETQEIKKVKGHESRQLAEDAMQEELMKEELINNHNEHLEVYKASTGKKQHTDRQKHLDLTTIQSMIDDKLSVQPINQDRRTTLYTVGPNYKPMKRIDVQPAKPVVRDPDDNSWRNESISSLGIVFKPSNSSTKSYKEVLKTKTETVFNNLQDKEYKDNTPELRERLEKIAEVRKKKKKIDKFGEVVYTDYEEGGSAEGTATSAPSSETISTEISSSEIPSTLPSLPQPETTSPMTTTKDDSYWKKKLGMISKEDIFKDLGLDVLTTQKAKKPYNLAEYYDSTDEYDADYVTLPNIDIKKKFTQPAPRMTTFPLLTSPLVLPTTRIVAPRFPERKPTVQYFPPTTKPHVNVNDYDVGFEKKVELYTLKDTPSTNTPFEFERVATNRPTTELRTARPADLTMFSPHSAQAPSRPVYMASDGDTEPRHIVVDDGNFSRGTYVIKHFRDFLSEAAKDDPPPDFEPLTESPRGIPVTDFRDTGKGTIDYDYGSQLRKDVLSRFVNNFNQNSDRFKVDFPVLFNSSVVHRSMDEEGRVIAQSSTFMKRLYGSEPAARSPGAGAGAGCAANCDTVELSPEYELHYFVPDQEEKEEMEPRLATAAAAPLRPL